MVDMREIGSIGIDHMGGRVIDEWHRDLQGVGALKLFREMIDNGIAGAWYSLFELLVRQGRPRVDRGRDAPSAELERDRIHESLHDMLTPLDVIVGESALGGAFGFVDWEKVFKVRRGPEEIDPTLRSMHSDGRIGWLDWALRTPETLCRWKFDDRSRWTHFVQAAPPEYREIPIPREKLIHFTPRPWKRSPEGRSMLRSASIPYRLAKGYSEQQGIAGFRNAAGLPYMTFPAESWDATSTDPQAQAAVALRLSMTKQLGQVRMGEYAALALPPETDRNGQPTGFKIGQLEGPKSLVPFDAWIKHWESRILITILCEHVLIGLDKANLSITGRDTDFFALSLGAILGGATEEMTRAAAELSTLNGVPPEDHAVIRHDDIEAPELGQMATYVATVLGIEPGRLNDVLRRHLETWGQLPIGALGEQPTEANVVLNGAQLDTQIKLMIAVGDGTISRDAAVNFLIINFGMSVDAAASIVPEPPMQSGDEATDV